VVRADDLTSIAIEKENLSSVVAEGFGGTCLIGDCRKEGRRPSAQRALGGASPLLEVGLASDLMPDPQVRADLIGSDFLGAELSGIFPPDDFLGFSRQGSQSDCPFRKIVGIRLVGPAGVGPGALFRVAKNVHSSFGIDSIIHGGPATPAIEEGNIVVLSPLGARDPEVPVLSPLGESESEPTISRIQGDEQHQWPSARDAKGAGDLILPA
jgi:hypothetical protein